MKIRWREFERAMRARVAPFDAVGSMTFWQRVEHRVNSLPPPPLWLRRGFLAVGVFFFLRATYRDMSDVDGSVGVFNLWLLAHAGARSFILRDLQSFPEAAAMRMLPIAPERAFGRIMVSASAGLPFIFMESLAVYALLTFNVPTPHWGLVVGMAFAQTVFYFALTALLARLRVRFEMMAAVLGFGVVLLIVINSAAFGGLAREMIYDGNPFGWVNGMFVDWAIHPQRAAWWGLVAVAASLLALPWSIRGLRERYLRGELKVEGRLKSKYLREQNADARKMILSGEFLSENSWTGGGVIEGLVWRRLTADEQRVAEVYCRSPLRLSWNFVAFGILFSMFVITTVLLPADRLANWFMDAMGTREGRMAMMVSFLIFLVWKMAMIIAFAGSVMWSGVLERFRKTGERMVFALGYRLMPVSFWETGKLFVKVATVLSLLFVPLAALFTLTWPGQMLMDYNPAGSFIALKGLIGFWCGIVYLVTLQWVPTIIEGLKYWRWGVVELAVLVLAVGSFGAFFNATILPWGWALGVLNVAVALGWFGFAGWRYRRALR